MEDAKKKSEKRHECRCGHGGSHECGHDHNTASKEGHGEHQHLHEEDSCECCQ